MSHSPRYYSLWHYLLWRYLLWRYLLPAYYGATHHATTYYGASPDHVPDALVPPPQCRRTAVALPPLRVPGARGIAVRIYPVGRSPLASGRRWSAITSPSSVASDRSAIRSRSHYSRSVHSRTKILKGLLSTTINSALWLVQPLSPVPKLRCSCDLNCYLACVLLCAWS